MRLSDAGRCACPCAGAPRLARGGIGALLYHSFGDVAAEKIRVNAMVSQVVSSWNACSDSATDATGQQLSTDFNAWYTSWQGFAATGQENVADFPDNDEWDTTIQYETELNALISRINAYCGAGLPGTNQTGPSPTNPLALLTTVVVVLAVAVVAVELAPLIGLTAKGLDELIE